MEKKYIELVDEEGTILVAETTLSPKQMKEAAFDEKYDDENLDYEMKMERCAKENGLFFECIEVDRLKI